jgi:hypothetical protein
LWKTLKEVIIEFRAGEPRPANADNGSAEEGTMGARLSSLLRHASFRSLSRKAALILLLVLSSFTCLAPKVRAEEIICNGPMQRPLMQHGDSEGKRPDLVVTGLCIVPAGEKYFFGNVNILRNGDLQFEEVLRGQSPSRTQNTKTEFWASSIIIENGGYLTALNLADVHPGGRPKEPFGSHGGTLKIYLYGKDESKWNEADEKFTAQNEGAPCKSRMIDRGGHQLGPCGIPKNRWDDNGKTLQNLPSGVHDYFYQYGPLHGDNSTGKPVGYFGKKVLAVSYGGHLNLLGYKGTCNDEEIKSAAEKPCQGLKLDSDLGNDHLTSQPAWTRLAKDLNANPKEDPTVKIEALLKGAQPGDEIVVTTTDYLPGHSELLKIKSVEDNGKSLVLDDAAEVKWKHNGTRFSFGSRLDKAGAKDRLIAGGMDEKLITNGAETRAAVAHLTRSIQIISGGDRAGETFDAAAERTKETCSAKKECYHFGAHLIIRQGFASVKIQGVEFKQMGQGGRLGHYPVHFHMARKTPPDTYVKDSVINESMTRWIVLHSTQGVTLARNIGYKSIGHGYYLEDGTETDNKFYSNLGIFARAAVDNIQNPRKVPGILAANGKLSNGANVPEKSLIYRSDYNYPTVFWITNGWNDFIGNMAAGAGTCGAAYWLVPAWNRNMSDVSRSGAVKTSGVWNNIIEVPNASPLPDWVVAGISVSDIDKPDSIPKGTKVKSVRRGADFATVELDVAPAEESISFVGHKIRFSDPNRAFEVNAKSSDNWNNIIRFKKGTLPTWVVAGMSVSDIDGPDSIPKGTTVQFVDDEKQKRFTTVGLKVRVGKDFITLAKHSIRFSGTGMQWEGYAALQWDDSFAGATPLKSFYGNYATSTMNSFQTVGGTNECHGVVASEQNNPNLLVAIPSSAPKPKVNEPEHYYPYAADAGNRYATKCSLVAGDQYDCSIFTNNAKPKCNNKPDVRDSKGPPLQGSDTRFSRTDGAAEYCGVTVLDHYTSSFHWAEQNFAAIWLRPQWYLVDNLVLTDVQQSGLNFITSGDYSRSALIEGNWQLARASVFVGTTQPLNPLASNSGPFSSESPIRCRRESQYCLSKDEGVSMQLQAFGTGQRLFNIYDGPAYQAANAYFDIFATDCGKEGNESGRCWMYGNTAGVRKDKDGICYLPNAAIGWKQPNGFYYPPSFHSKNLFFDKVDIRHYVIDALFDKNTYDTDLTTLRNHYCKPVDKDKDYAKDFFKGFTDIDRQTELNDDDGSLTGLTNDADTGTISVNPTEFFKAPLETAECLSNVRVTPNEACPVVQPPTPTTAITSPYDYVTTVIYPGCAVRTGDRYTFCGTSPTDVPSADDKGQGKRYAQKMMRGGIWSMDCANEKCYGVPLYRQLLTEEEKKAWENANCKDAENRTKTEEEKKVWEKKCRGPMVRMGGQATYQRSTLTINHGTYFLDTTVSAQKQEKGEDFTSTKPCDIVKEGSCEPRSVNVFEAKETYYMFFPFAKNATKQTYQIYVGNGFKRDTVKAIRPKLLTLPVESVREVDWPKKWVIDVSSLPILKVTIDFANEEDYKFEIKDETGKVSTRKIPKGLCRPRTFCKDGKDRKNNEVCTCALEDNDPLVKANPAIRGACVSACQEWAVKDLDYPQEGPLGFSFTLPDDFKAEDQGLKFRPEPLLFPSSDEGLRPNWSTKFSRSGLAPDDKTPPDKTSGPNCYYARLPLRDKPCAAPD